MPTCREPGCPVEVEVIWDKPGPFGKPPLVLAVGSRKPHYHNKPGQKKGDDFAKQIDQAEKLWNPNLFRKYGSEWGCKYCSKHGDRFYMHNHDCSHTKNRAEDPFWQAHKPENVAPELPVGQERLF